MEGPKRAFGRLTPNGWLMKLKLLIWSLISLDHFQDDAERSFAPFPQTAAVMMISIMPESSIRGSTANLFASLYTAAKSSRTLPAMSGYRS